MNSEVKQQKEIVYPVIIVLGKTMNHLLYPHFICSDNSGGAASRSNVYAKLIGEMENSPDYAEKYHRFQKEQRPSQVYVRLDEAAEIADGTSR